MRRPRALIKAVNAQSEQGTGEAEKSRQEVLEPSLKKAQQASESLLAQVSLGGNGALKDVLKHYQVDDLTKLLEQLQSLSLSEDTPDTKIRPSLGRDVQTLKNLLAQEPFKSQRPIEPNLSLRASASGEHLSHHQRHGFVRATRLTTPWRTSLGLVKKF